MRVLISTGEPSAAVLAAVIEQELTVASDVVRVFRHDAGAILGPVFGFGAGLRAAPKLGRALARSLAEIRAAKPDVVVLVSFSGLHLPLGRRIRALGIPVVYVSPPQVWAWGAGRGRALRDAADRIVCLFSFEQEYLSRIGVRSEYFGHPLLDSVRPVLFEQEVRQRMRLGPEPYVAFLPGSRPTENRFHLPLFYRVFELLQSRFPLLGGVMVGPGAICRLPATGGRLPLSDRYSVMAHAACVVAVSGTVTAEAAILGTPMVVCYHLSRFSTFVARKLARVRYFALPNILAGARIVPELLNPSSGLLAEETARLLADDAARAEMRGHLARVRDRLGPPGAARRIARLVRELAG
jgi:lipid-A-disaccharide synthase